MLRPARRPPLQEREQADQQPSEGQRPLVEGRGRAVGFGVLLNGLQGVDDAVYLLQFLGVAGAEIAAAGGGGNGGQGVFVQIR